MTRGISKHTPEAYAEMRRLYHDEGWSQGRLARRYDMSAVQVGRIVRGESQRGAPNPNPPALASDIAASEARMLEFAQALEREEPREMTEEEKILDSLKPKDPNRYK